MRIEAGRFKGRRLPDVGDARPVGGRLRRSLFSAIADWLDGARVLDLFAGVGGLGLEALSRGASGVTLVEQDPRAADALLRWIDAAGVGEEVRVLRRDARRIAPPTGPFDLVFLDPPYRLWETEAAALLARAVALLEPTEGLLVLKVPARAKLPEDGPWRLLRRREVGSNAWVLLAAPEAPSGDVIRP